MKKYFAYYNQYKNGIDIAFDDNVLLFISCSESEKDLHTLKYDTLALDCELQAWIAAMDEDWCF